MEWVYEDEEEEQDRGKKEHAKTGLLIVAFVLKASTTSLERG